MDKFYNYAIVKFDPTRVWLCRAPFGYSIKPGDLVDTERHGRGEVLAVEMATENNSMINLLDKINYPNGIENIDTVYSKKDVKWGTEND